VFASRATLFQMWTAALPSDLTCIVLSYLCPLEFEKLETDYQCDPISYPIGFPLPTWKNYLRLHDEPLHVPDPATHGLIAWVGSPPYLARKVNHARALISLGVDCPISRCLATRGQCNDSFGLCYAIAAGCVGLVRALVEGANRIKPDPHHLQLAIGSGRVDILLCLCEHSAWDEQELMNGLVHLKQQLIDLPRDKPFTLFAGRVETVEQVNARCMKDISLVCQNVALEAGHGFSELFCQFFHQAISRCAKLGHLDMLRYLCQSEQETTRANQYGLDIHREKQSNIKGLLMNAIHNTRVLQFLLHHPRFCFSSSEEQPFWREMVNMAVNGNNEEPLTLVAMSADSKFRYSKVVRSVVLQRCAQLRACGLIARLFDSWFAPELHVIPSETDNFSYETTMPPAALVSSSSQQTPLLGKRKQARRIGIKLANMWEWIEPALLVSVRKGYADITSILLSQMDRVADDNVTRACIPHMKSTLIYCWRYRGRCLQLVEEKMQELEARLSDTSTSSAPSPKRVKLV
jgi:hypothetical protein